MSANTELRLAGNAAKHGRVRGSVKPITLSELSTGAKATIASIGLTVLGGCYLVSKISYEIGQGLKSPDSAFGIAALALIAAGGLAAGFFLTHRRQ